VGEIGREYDKHESMAGMLPSLIYGIASLLLLAVSIALPSTGVSQFPWVPILWLFAFGLGILAAKHGSKWWLLLPATTLLMAVFVASILLSHSLR